MSTPSPTMTRPRERASARVAARAIAPILPLRFVSPLEDDEPRLPRLLSPDRLGRDVELPRSRSPWLPLPLPEEPLGDERPLEPPPSVVRRWAARLPAEARPRTRAIVRVRFM